MFLASHRKKKPKQQPQLCGRRPVQDGGDGVVGVHLDHLGDRVRRLRARLLPPRLPSRHDGRDQLQLGVRRRVSLWR